MEKPNTAVVHYHPDFRHSDFPLDCESRAYKRFSLKMDRQLRKLAAEWIHLAAPSAMRVQRRFSGPLPAPKK